MAPHGWACFEIQICLDASLSMMNRCHSMWLDLITYECLDASLSMMNRCHSIWLDLITYECKNIKLDLHLRIELPTVYVCILAVGPYERLCTVLQ